MERKVRVLVVDDSAIVREILTERLSRHPGIEVVGSAVDPYIARDKLERTEVDVITLDIEMPRMDGLTFLRQLMAHYPKPVIVVSSLAKDSNSAVMRALELGAVDVVPKPGGPFSVEDVIDLLSERIVAASRADLSRLRRGVDRLSEGAREGPRRKYLAELASTNKILAIGTSTGGTIALETLFRDWDPGFPPTVAVIHMPERFTGLFADRLNELSPATVKEAEDGERLRQGTVYIAPGNYHLLVAARGTEWTTRIVGGPKVCNQRPAVDPLFESVAEHIGRNATGILLTGMGRDGARGLLAMRAAGAFTIAQDEASSIVWGMPKEAIDLGAAAEVLPLEGMVDRLRKLYS